MRWAGCDRTAEPPIRSSGQFSGISCLDNCRESTDSLAVAHPAALSTLPGAPPVEEKGAAIAA
ncbi:MAG TPA: hypothetical protein VLS96_01060 [Nodosilinea sp.]|nr:hypothetical protein [Nodosilinea sp.]